VREYYAQKVLDLEDEKEKAIEDMTEAGSIVIDDFANNYGVALDSMTMVTEDFETYFNDAIDSMEAASQDY
jgi:hypothetical protein